MFNQLSKLHNYFLKKLTITSCFKIFKAIPYKSWDFIRVKKILFIFLILSLVFIGCSIDGNGKSFTEEKNEIKNNVSNNINQYNINVEFNPNQKTIKGNQRVIYINNEKTKIDKVYFHLYPNAFSKKETAPFIINDFIRVYPIGFSEGYIDVQGVYINGEKALYNIDESNNTIMELRLPHELDVGDKINIDMEYTIKIPPAVERFGYGNDTYNLGNWYPVIAVYDDSGWNLDPYYPIGDPFYTDISNYKVTIKAPKDFVIASTGNVISAETIDDITKWTIEAKAFRDFAFVASNKFEILEKEIDGTLVEMYFIDDGTVKEDIKNKALEFAEDSLKIFNEIFGKYPYKKYSVVQTNFPSGMEYPGIIFIGSEYYQNFFKDSLEVLIVHETAHQWWYGVVGNDQIDEAWLDESFASYCEVIYFSEKYGEKLGDKYHEYENEETLNQEVDYLNSKKILSSLDDFEGWNDYSLLVYTKGAMFLDDIKDKYGKDMLYKILKTYYNRYKFKIATTEDFLDICEEVTGEELEDYFDEWLK
ncbi:Aminopeptidase N [Maledivibacter halophilus]|uniref:Aminopeptidase N n=1 Tax=Maledivibacter halophilus TaxID=36842 RepID=A0A1T5MV94_9FIRM|nr:Aminopeptidase N [Maledivibacter halophilus]